MDDLPITLADVVVVGIVLLSGILAFVRGFVREVLAIAAWVGAIAVAFFSYPLLAPHLSGFLPDTRMANVAAGGAIFLVAIIILSIITRLASGGIKGSALNALDRSLGFVFGLARGALLVVLTFIGLSFLFGKAEQPDWLRNAASYGLVEQGAVLVRSFIPGDALEEGKKAVDKATDAADKAMRAEQAYRQMVNPDPKGVATKSAPRGDGYNVKERRDFERLIESTGGDR